MLKTLLAILFSLLLSAAHAQHATDTFRLYFDLGISAMNAGTQKKVDLLVYDDKIINGSSIMIVGYADYLGSEMHNKNLSMERARNVKNYLVKYGINADDIKLCVGKGEIHRQGMRNKEGYPTDRRVDIVVNNMRESNQKFAAGPKKDTSRNKKPAPVTNFDEKNLKAGSTITLKNVYFPADRHTIKPESKETLEKLYTVLKEHPNLKISIEGHVCCVKDYQDALDIDTYEPILSVNRAKAIYNYLVSRGIDSSRLKYAGFGRSRPVVPVEVTEEDAEKNRRVEIRVIENK
jgi:outer membrane protein OmpA-like peptidoglycan-associated protein